MIDTIGSVLGLLGSGVGGGLLGGIFGIWKQRQERIERAEMARIELERDQAEYANAKAERDHSLVLLEKGAQLEVDKIEVEAEAEMEIANQAALGGAQRAEFGKLNTTSGMDNFRACVRPVLALWAWALFNSMLGWAFYKFADRIDAEMGLQILLGLFATLNFTVSSIVTFYYVARRNNSPKI